MTDSNDSIFSSILSSQSDNPVQEEMQGLLIEYFSRGQKEGEALKELLSKTNTSLAESLAAHVLTAETGTAIPLLVNFSKIGAVIGAAAVPIAPIAGGALGYVAGFSISCIPGVKKITDRVVALAAGLLIGSSVYVMQSLSSRWISIDKFKNFLEADLDSWQIEILRTKPLPIQECADILARYLKYKAEGVTGHIRLLLVSFKCSSSNFYFINSYIKTLLLLLTYLNDLQKSTIIKLLDLIEQDIKNNKRKLDRDFIEIFNKFKSIVLEYVKKRIQDETIVEKISVTLCSAESGLAPILPWLYSSFKGNDNNTSFYNPKEFNLMIQKETIQSQNFKFWSDLQIFSVHQIKDMKNQINENNDDKNLKNIAKKVGKISSLIEIINKTKLSDTGIQSIPKNMDLNKIEVKISKLLDYAEAFLTYISDEKKFKNQYLNKIKEVKLYTTKLLGMNPLNPENTSSTSKAIQNAIQWWNASEKKYTELNKAVGNVKYHSTKASIQYDIRMLNSGDKFRNIIESAMKIQKFFNDNIGFKKYISEENEIANAELAKCFPHKIDSFCELMNYASKLGQFLMNGKTQTNVSVYSLFSLWSIFNMLLDSWSILIPKEIYKYESDKKTASDFMLSETLNKYCVIPYETFKKLLIPGLNEKFKVENEKDFFRVFIYYFSNIINLVSEIQYHIEALKKSKLIIAMFGETSFNLMNLKIPLQCIFIKTNKLIKTIEDFIDYVNKFQMSQDIEKNKSYINMIGLFDAIYGKKTGNFLRFDKRSKNILSRIRSYKSFVEDLLDYIEEKCASKLYEDRYMDSEIAKNMNPMFSKYLEFYDDYLISIIKVYPELNPINSSNGNTKTNLKFQSHVPELKEKFLSFMQDKLFVSENTNDSRGLAGFAAAGLVSAGGKGLSALHASSENGLSNSYLKMMYFIKNISSSEKFKSPNKIYELSKNKIQLTGSCSEETSKFFKELSYLLNCGEGEKITLDCIALVDNNIELQKELNVAFVTYPIFRLFENPPFLEQPFVLKSFTLTRFIVLKETTNIKLMSTQNLHSADFEDTLKLVHQHKNDIINSEKYKKLFHKSDSSNDENTNDILINILLYSFFFYPANPTFIFEKSVNAKKNLFFLKAIWALYGMTIAYMLSTQREYIEKLIISLDNNYKSKILNIVENNQKYVHQKEELKIQKMRVSQLETENEQILKHQEFKVYPSIRHALEQHVERLGDTEKAKKLKDIIEQTNIFIIENRNDKSDKQNAIHLIIKVTPIISQHRTILGLGKTSSYSDILALAARYGITKEALVKGDEFNG